MTSFPSTHLSFVLELRQADPDARRQLLQVFLVRYLPPMRAFLRHDFRQLSSHQLEDFLQDFVTDHVLHKSLLEVFEKERGKLRTFICQCLKNSVYGKLRREARRHELRQEPKHFLPPQDTEPQTSDSFDRAWAQHILCEAIVNFKNECHRQGRDVLWAVFDLRVLRQLTVGAPPLPYDELSQRCDTPVHRLQNLLTTAKRRFRFHVERMIRDYALTDEEVQDEINDLMKISAQYAPSADFGEH